MPKAAVLDEKRLARVTTLKSGSHAKPNGEFEACVMEAVAYVSGQPWSDHPTCVCPVITAFMVSWNDGLPNDEDRTRLLLPLIPKLIGTRGSKALANRRAAMAADWLVRTHTPAWLRLAGLDAEADALETLPEITDFAQTPSIMAPLKASRDAASKKRAAAWDAAWAAARDAAWAAAGAAAGAAARDAAWAAAGAAAGAAAWDAAWAAAWDAAWAAAWDAAWDAAWAAAWDAAWAAAGAAAWAAAWAAAKPTAGTLQASALSLVERMCDLKEAATLTGER